MKQYRQGDVFIKEIKAEDLPKKRRRVNLEFGHIVLAHGEVTGHTHAIREPKKAFLSKDIQETRAFLEVKEPVNLVHEEHSTITLPAGNYEVIQQREYSMRELRRTTD